jgi:hypothetical protein
MQTTQTPIKAAIGSAVRFFPASSGDADITPFQVGEIAHLWSDTCANIQFSLPDDRIVIRSSVPLFQYNQGYENGCRSYYAELIPNQQAVADEAPASIEAEILAKGLTAPRITIEDIEDNIDTEVYFTAQHGVEGALSSLQLHSRHPVGLQAGNLSLLTLCVLVLRNGFMATGESACASPENFDAEMGRKLARANAVRKIWPLMGYELRSALQSEAVIKPVELQVELRTDDPAIDLRDVVAGMTLSPSAIKHPSEFTEPQLDAIAKGLMANSGYDQDEAATGDRSDGVGEGPAGESGDDLPDTHPN